MIHFSLTKSLRARNVRLRFPNRHYIPFEKWRTPGKSRATPGKSRATPGKLRATPGKLRATPGKLRATPGKSRATPGNWLRAKHGKSSTTPGMLRATPGKSRATPRKPRATSGKSRATPGKSPIQRTHFLELAQKMFSTRGKLGVEPLLKTRRSFFFASLMISSSSRGNGALFGIRASFFTGRSAISEFRLCLCCLYLSRIASQISKNKEKKRSLYISHECPILVWGCRNMFLSLWLSLSSKQFTFKYQTGSHFIYNC